MQLVETECLVVAHKKKLEYVECLNVDLQQANGKLKKEIRALEKMTRLPDHPVINKFRAEFQNER